MFQFSNFNKKDKTMQLKYKSKAKLLTDDFICIVYFITKFNFKN